MHTGINTQEYLVIEKKTCLNVQRKKYTEPHISIYPTLPLHSTFFKKASTADSVSLYGHIQTTTPGLGDARVRMKASEFCTLWSSTKEEQSKDKGR